jgi:hypothetical protein
VLNPLWVAYNFFVGHPAGQLARLHLNDDTNPRLRVAHFARSRLNQLPIVRPALYTTDIVQFTRLHPRTRRPALSSTIVKSPAPQYTTHPVDTTLHPISFRHPTISHDHLTLRVASFTRPHPTSRPRPTDTRPIADTPHNGAPHLLSISHVGPRWPSTPGSQAHA